MKQYLFYEIQETFRSLVTPNLLPVFYELLTREDNRPFFLAQREKLITNIPKEQIANLLNQHFANRLNYHTESDTEFVLEHTLFDNMERLIIDQECVRVEYQGNQSLFFQFMALHFPSMIAINPIQEEILELSLVKPSYLG